MTPLLLHVVTIVTATVISGVAYSNLTAIVITTAAATGLL